MNKDIDWVWGLDVSTTKIAFGFLPLEVGAGRVQANFVAIEETMLAALPERLVQTLERTQLFVEAMSVHFPPVAVRVEQPMGGSPLPPSPRRGRSRSRRCVRRCPRAC